MPALLTLDEVAKLLKVSTRTVQRLPLRFAKIGKSRRYEVRDVERYVESRIARKRAAA